MKKLIYVATIILFFGTSVVRAEFKQGTCKLKEWSAFDEDVFTVEVGKQIKGTCKFYIDEFFSKKIVNANIKIENTSTVPLFCYYYVAFFDNSGNLVGCGAQESFSGGGGLKPGESLLLGSCLMPLPEGQHEKISSYKIAFYESEVPIGKIKK